MAILILASVTAVATLVYGFATVFLWYENRQDRLERQRRFNEESAARKLDELRRAFYEAWGYWNGHGHRPSGQPPDASQTGRVFEALIRLECQLRLNDYKKEANGLGFAIRSSLHGVEKQLDEVGLALGLLPSTYQPIRI